MIPSSIRDVRESRADVENTRADMEWAMSMRVAHHETMEKNALGDDHCLGVNEFANSFAASSRRIGSLTPPKGRRGSETTMPLMKTIPAQLRSESSCRWDHCQALAPRPNCCRLRLQCFRAIGYAK